MSSLFLFFLGISAGTLVGYFVGYVFGFEKAGQLAEECTPERRK